MKLKKKQVSKQFLFCLCVWFYICVQSMILFRQSGLRYAVMLISIAGMFIFAEQLRISAHLKVIALLYFALLLTTVFGSFAQSDMHGVIQLCKVLMHLTILVLVLMVSKKSVSILEDYMKIYLFISVLTSIQCIILFVVVWFGWAKGQMIYFESAGLYKYSFGILGFGDAINYFGKSAFLRTAGFFREPTKLGVFLIAPICWSYAQYRKLKKKRYLLYELLLCLNFLATVSRACFLALAVGVVCVYLFRTRSDRRNYCISPYKRLKATILIVSCAVVFLILGNYLYQYSQTEEEMYANSSTYENNAIMGMINRSSTMQSRYGNVFIRDDSSFGQLFQRVVREPFGYGLGWSGREQEFNNPTGLGFWVYSGGFLAFAVLIILYGWLFYHYYLGCMYSGDMQMKVFGIAFLAYTIQNMSYGSWEEPLYMLLIALMILAVEIKEESAKALC